MKSQSHVNEHVPNTNTRKIAFRKNGPRNGSKNALSPFEQIVVQLSEGGDGFGVGNERDDAAGGRQNGIYCKLAEAAGYRGKQRGIALTVFSHDERDRCYGGAFGKSAADVGKLAQRGAAVVFAEDGGTLLRAVPCEHRAVADFCSVCFMFYGNLG